VYCILFPFSFSHRLRSLHFKTDFQHQHLQGILLIDISYRSLPGAIAREIEWTSNSHLHCLVKRKLPQHAIEEQQLCCSVMLLATSPLPAIGQLKLKINSYFVGYKLSRGLKTEELHTKMNA